MKNFILFIFTLTFINVRAQQDQKDINDQVWIPFTKAIMTQDVEGFVKVHSKDLVRAERDSKKVLTLSEYQKRMVASWPKWKEQIAKDKLKYIFELRFTERISNGTQAFEVGYFQNEVTKPNGEIQKDYGRFQVALRKENGIWKILVDSDSSEGRSITEKDFLEAKTLQE